MDIQAQAGTTFRTRPSTGTIETRRLRRNHIQPARDKATDGGCTGHPYVWRDIISHECEVQRAHVPPRPSGDDAPECHGHARLEEVPARHPEERRRIESL